MRRITKFSSLKLRFLSFFFLKQRILRLKRPKWRFIQKLVQPFFLLLRSRVDSVARLKIRDRRCVLLYSPFDAVSSCQFFINQKNFQKKRMLNLLRVYFFQPTFLYRGCFRWVRSKLLFKESLQMKRLFLSYYDFSFKLSYFISDFKKVKLRSYVLSLFFIKPEFRLDIVLWRLNFFFSVYAARHAIYSRVILYNFKFIRKIIFVTFGDILLLVPKRCKYSFLLAVNRFLLFSLVPGHFEVDFYSGLILCVHSSFKYSLQDTILIKRNAFNLSCLKNYLVRKY